VRLSLASKAGPQAAVDSLYRRHGGDVYRYALAVTGDPGDAEDVTQTTFLNAFRAIERGDQIREPKAWLRTIAHNVCRQRFRQDARQPSEVPFDDEVADMVVEHDGPTADDLVRALRRLPFNQRSALVMRELEGRSPREIAEALGVTLSATETLLFRARRSLREQLEGSLSCRQAEEAVSRQADGMLGRADRGALRAHLRECSECARMAKSVRAQRGALRSLAALPLPPGLALASGMGPSAGGAAVVGSVFGKLAIGGAAAALVAGGGAAAISTHPWRPPHPQRQDASRHAATPARPSPLAPARVKLAAAPALGLTGGGATTGAARRTTPALRAAVHTSSPAPVTEDPTGKPRHAAGTPAKPANPAKPVRRAAAPKNAVKARRPNRGKPSSGPQHPQTPARHATANSTPKHRQPTQPAKSPVAAPATPSKKVHPPSDPGPTARTDSCQTGSRGAGTGDCAPSTAGG
jgi:RNA polymerase sigma factor (sigma-70 family)